MYVILNWINKSTKCAHSSIDTNTQCLTNKSGSKLIIVRHFLGADSKNIKSPNVESRMGS